MNDKEFYLEVLTPEKVFYKGVTESLVVNSQTGKMGILKDSAPIVTALLPGQLTFLVGTEWKLAVAGQGFMQVREKEVMIFCETAKWPNEIDIVELEEERDLNERIIREAKSKKEYMISKEALARIFEELKLKK